MMRHCAQFAVRTKVLFRVAFANYGALLFAPSVERTRKLLYRYTCRRTEHDWCS